MLSETFTDKNMKVIAEEAMESKRTSYSTKELVDHIFTIEQRGEFEKKEDWNKRVEAFANDGIFVFYEQATKAKYDIDNESMEFSFPINWHYGSTILYRGDWIGNGRNLYFIEGEYGKGFVKEALNKRLKADKNVSGSGAVSEEVRMSIKISPEEAKALQSDEKNAYFMLYAIKITGKDIENREKKASLGMESTIKGLFLGASVVATNGENSQKVLLSYGLDGNK
jgi:hypothetical protein